MMANTTHSDQESENIINIIDIDEETLNIGKTLRMDISSINNNEISVVDVADSSTTEAEARCDGIITINKQAKNVNICQNQI